jgi:DNA-binding beta-propeller fold protein YncE
MRSALIVRLRHALSACALLVAPSLAQHAQVSAVAIDPANPDQVWVCNKFNRSVSLIDVSTDQVLSEVRVGHWPRSCSLSADGSKLFVACQRGNVDEEQNSVIGMPANPVFGAVTVIDTQARQLSAVIYDVGVEPYGIAVAPNGKWFAVSGFRSGTIKFFDAVTHAPLLEHQYSRSLNFIPPPLTVKDVDENRDGLADLGDPRGFTIRSDSQALYVTHHKSPYVSVLDLGLDANGLPSSVLLGAKINFDDYAFHPIFNPVPVQELKSQGVPRFMEDIALSPDGSVAVVPHLLHNVNHDVNHDFGSALQGDFANRVYPALTLIDAVNESYGQAGDSSKRLHHELDDEPEPAEYGSIGEPIPFTNGDTVLLGATGAPTLGGSADFLITGQSTTDLAQLFIGTQELQQLTPEGVKRVVPRFAFDISSGSKSINIPSSAALDGLTLVCQARITRITGEHRYTNAVRMRLRPSGVPADELGHRAGHPSRVLFNAAGDRLLLLNRGSEDVFLYEVQAGQLSLKAVYPPRIGFAPRAPMDTTTSMGDLPIGIALHEEPGTDRARIYIINEVTRTLSHLEVDFANNVFAEASPQIKTLLTPDAMSFSARRGLEIFEDASREETTGNFNNSCASCHFEGGEDGNVWQRPAGPRSTMPVYGGSLGTGLLLWKGVRLHMGETGPMFGGENGGTGDFIEAERQALIDYHEEIPFPLNPNLDLATGDLKPLAQLGRDLFFGLDDTGLNPTLRHAGCAECHPNIETNPGSSPGPRLYTADFLSPLITQQPHFEIWDPECFSLRENIVQPNIRNVNTGVNLDLDNDGAPDLDRNLDLYSDIETYVPMNPDGADGFRRDDPNSWACPCDPVFDPNCDPANPFRFFSREATHFSIPTKMGVFATAPYFHGHGPLSLRALLDPEVQTSGDPIYGDAAYSDGISRAGLTKNFNEFHDVRGHEQFVPSISKVQQTLVSTNPDADLEALLAFIESL